MAALEHLQSQLSFLQQSDRIEWYNWLKMDRVSCAHHLNEWDINLEKCCPKCLERQKANNVKRIAIKALYFSAYGDQRARGGLKIQS